MKDERLTEHFHLSEFLRSETAARLGIPNEPTPETIENLRRNAEGMELIRGFLLVAVLISSGLRAEALERVLCEKDYAAWCKRHAIMPSDVAWKTYFARKKHPFGLATDFIAPAFGTPIEVARAIAGSEIPFDQLIYEHTWVHVSWPRAGEEPRREVLTQIPGGYASGILESTEA